MSAFRDARSIQPISLAHQYRLNIVPRKKAPAKVERTRRVQEATSDISINNNDDNEYDQINRHMSLSRSSYLDEEEENDFYFRCDSPLTPKDEGDSSVKIYELACKKYKLLPLSSVKKGLQTMKLTCQSIQLNYNDCKCICFALVHNTHVESIEFEENGMNQISAALFAEVVSENENLTHVKLANNNLKSEGVKAICQAVVSSKSILSLDLSGNGLVENDGEYIRSMLENSDCLRELHLGHNNLTDKGIISISEALKDNKELRILDLKWNHIRLHGALAIGEALERNTSLEIVNLAWNGLHKEGASSIAYALKKNRSLVELDLTCNRLTEECIATILKGLNGNDTLEKLIIGQNQISTRGALAILQYINENKTSTLNYLDFGNLEVHDIFEEIYNEMKKSRDIKIKYGPVWSTGRQPLDDGNGDDEYALLDCNPLTVLMECMRIQNLRLIDFFKSLDSDRSNMICVSELCDGMINVGVPIRRQTLLRLLRKLDKDNNGQLDFGEMIEAQKIHRQNIRTIFAVSGVDFDQTDIGKVSLLLRKIMSTNFIMKKTVTDTRKKSAQSENDTVAEIQTDT